VYLLITRVKPMVTYFSDFAFCYEKLLRSNNQSQKNKQPQAFYKYYAEYLQKQISRKINDIK